MRISDIESPVTTTLVIKHPVTGEPYGDKGNPIKITGYTTDSSEWKQAEKAVLDPSKKQQILLGKKNEPNRLEIDPKNAEDIKKILARVVTNIEGLDDWIFSTEAVEEIFNNPRLQFIVDQWAEHVSDRSNFYKRQEKTVKSGSKP